MSTDGVHVFIADQFLGTTNLGGADMVEAGGYDAFVVPYNAVDETHVWSQHLGGLGLDSGISLAATSTRLAASVTFYQDTLRVGMQTFTATQDDVAIVRFNPSTSVASLAAQFGSSGMDTMALAHANDRLIEVCAFSTSVEIIGTRLTSEGGSDIASFRTNF